MKQSKLQLQKYLEKHFFEPSKNIGLADLLDFSHILYFAIECDLMLEAYENCLAEKYDVLVPFSQLFRNIDMFSLPVLDALIDENNQITKFTEYNGDFKKKWENIYKPFKNDDISVDARKRKLGRRKGLLITSDRKIYPYKELVLYNDNLYLPIIYKSLLYMLIECIHKDLLLSLNELETKVLNANELPNTLKNTTEILREFKSGLDAFDEANLRLQETLFRNKNLEVEELIGKLILFKQIEQIIPFSQIRGLNNEHFSNLHAVKRDFNSSLLRQIDQDSGLFLSKTLLASLIYSTDTEERYITWKELNSKLQKIQEKMQKERDIKDLKKIKSYFSQPKVKTFLSILRTTDLEFVENIRDSTKLYFYLRYAKWNPVSRISNIKIINERFNCLKGEQ